VTSAFGGRGRHRQINNINELKWPQNRSGGVLDAIRSWMASPAMFLVAEGVNLMSAFDPKRT